MASQNPSSGVMMAAALAKESTEAAFDAVNRLAVTPPELHTSKEHLEKTRSTLVTLTARLADTSEEAERLPPLLQQLRLYDPLYTIKQICTAFERDIVLDGIGASSDSDARNANVQKFNTELSAVHQTFTAVLVSINLILTSESTLALLDAQFRAQEDSLQKTMERLVQDRHALKTTQQDARVLAELQDLCRRTTEATKAGRLKQTFGTMTLDKSWGMQGIVGPAQIGVEQTFGDLKGADYSRGFQGQIDPASFGVLFQKTR